MNAPVERDDDILLTEEVAALTRLPEGTLRSYRHAGRGPRCFKIGGRRVGYLRRDVKAWIESQIETSSIGGAA